MKKYFLLLLLTVSWLYPQNKVLYDIDDSGMALKKITYDDYVKKELSNEQLSATLISGGYFTIGTNKGLSDKTVDDNCQITFGHPFALTSFPIIKLDDTWYSPEELFTELSPVLSGDTLSISGISQDGISMFFRLILSDHASVDLEMELANNSGQDINIAGGFQFDPALGKNGDGAIYIQDVLKEAPLLISQSVPNNIDIWEKALGAKGLSTSLVFNSDKPEKILIDNWDNLEEDKNAETVSEDLLIFDAAIKMMWPSATLPPGQSYTTQFTVELNEPDFSEPLFIRCDLPGSLALINGFIYPENITTTLEIYNLENISGEKTLSIEYPEFFSATNNSEQISIPSGNISYHQVYLTSGARYEEKYSEIGFTISSGNDIYDTYSKKIYVPSLPLFYEGLTISNDTIKTGNFPQVELNFDLYKTEDGSPLYGLKKENVFLYENGVKVNDFTLSNVTDGTAKLADVVFVLDCSGSMGDEIDQVRSNINEFADSLVARGYDFQIGIVTFSTTIDHTWDFTNNVQQLEANLASISLWGGIEDSPLALYTGSELSFRPNSTRNIIWVTDEPYPEDSYTKEEIVNRMLSMGIVVHGVGLNELQTEWFNPIVQPTGGNFYDITGNFRDILLDVAKLEASNSYNLSYLSNSASPSGNTMKLELHYGNRGAVKEYSFSESANEKKLPKVLDFYPNPFNPEISFNINTDNYKQGELTIYNALGQQVKTFNLHGASRLTWNAVNDFGNKVATGFYIVRLTYTGPDMKLHSETAKILYLK